MTGLFSELRRRRVFRVIAIYTVIALGVLQAADLILPPLHAPDWAMTALVVAALVGLPVAIALSWMFDVHPDGAVRAPGHAPAAAAPAKRWPRVALGVGLIVVLAVVGGGLYRGLARADADHVGAIAAVDRSIAVLPFRNMSGNPQTEWFSDGITEDVLNSLASIGDLRVISRTSAMRYKGSDKLLPEIARELGVAHILEGSVQRAGNQLRITAQLIRARDDAHLWSEQYDRPADDVFAVQTEIARAISDRLEATLSSGERERIEAAPTDDIAAYNVFLRGRAAYFQFTPDENERAIDFFRDAIGRDPDFALAHAFLARAMSIQSRMGGPAWTDSATAAARRAIELAPEAPDGYSALGEALRESGRHEEALEQYRHALAIDPNHAVSVAEMGETHSFVGLGNLDQSIRWLVRATRLDPATAWIYGVIVHDYALLGDLDAAEAWTTTLEQAIPGSAWILRARILVAAYRGDRATFDRLAMQAADEELPAQAFEADGRLQLGDFEGARRAADAWLAANTGTAPVAVAVAIAHADRERALPLLDAIERKADAALDAGSAHPDLHRTLARAALAGGDRAGAIAHLEDWVEAGGIDVPQLRSPELDPLRTEAGFQVVARRMTARADSMRTSLARDGL